MFDRAKLARLRVRADNRGTSFLVERVCGDAAERLMDVNRRFERALIIGPPESKTMILGGLPPEKHPVDIVQFYETASQKFGGVRGKEDALPFEPGSFDLIIAILTLHSINDLPGHLIQVKQILTEDGLFIGSLFGGDTLTELRQALYQADDINFGGALPRVSPFMTDTQAAGLLQRCGFTLPVVDTDKVLVKYRDISRLWSDIRDMGESNSLLQAQSRYMPKRYINDLRNAYAAGFADQTTGTLKAAFEIIWMTGWAPSDKQPKPLRPGSAKMSLAEGLRTIRDSST